MAQEKAKVEAGQEEKPAEVADNTAPAPKKSSGLKIVLIILAVIIGLGIITSVAAGYLIKKAAQKATGITTSGDTTTIGSGDNKITVSDNQKWPESAPSVVPKFTDGKITGTTRIGDYWTITIGEVTKSEYDTYKAALRNQGFVTEEGSEIEMDDTAGYTTKKGVYKVSPSYTVSEKSLLISIVKEEE